MAGSEAEEAVGSAEMMEVSGLCMKCHNPDGVHRILPHKIPHFKEIIIMSFECPQCGFRSNKVEPAAELAPRGKRIRLSLQSAEDLNRQVIKSEHASFHLPALEFEMPPTGNTGCATTVEGLFKTAISDLVETQSERRLVAPETATKIDAFVDALESYVGGQHWPFDVVLVDASGNSYIEQRNAVDPAISVTEFERTREDLEAMGHFGDQEVSEPLDGKTEVNGASDLPHTLRPAAGTTATKVLEAATGQTAAIAEGDAAEYRSDEPMTFETPCCRCGRSGQTNMVEIDIPGFRRCILMSFTCERCGYRSNEVKAAGAYGEKGRRWELTVTDPADLNRDVLKADTASVCLPDIDFLATAGTLGGIFTTIEGLLKDLATSLQDHNPFVTGDSATDVEMRKNLKETLRKIEMCAAGDPLCLPFKVIVDDCADHSYIGRRTPTFHVEESLASAKTDAGAAADANLVQVLYERSDDQNDELGLKDMNVDVQ